MKATLLAASLALAGPASAEVLWRGDVETGTLSQFSGGPNQSKVTVVRAPVRDGNYAARMLLLNENVWPNGLRRVEVGYTPPKASFENSERYYAFSVRTDTDVPLVPTIDNTLAYFESSPTYKQVMALTTTGGKVSFVTRLPNKVHWTGPFAPGTWLDVVLHVKWSADPTVGFVELWVDGERVLPKTLVQTMYTAGGQTDPNFFHAGLLHRDFDTDPQAVFFDRILEGTQLTDVLIAKPSPEPDAGTPDAGTPDAGTPDAETADAGMTEVDAGPLFPGFPGDTDAGTSPDSPELPRAGAVTGQAGCGVTTGVGASLAAWIVLAWTRRRRR